MVLKQAQSSNLPTWAPVHHHLQACDAFFGRWWRWKLDAGIRRYDLTQRSCNFPAISWKMDLFSAAMSHGNEGKQVVLLLEYGLNDVPSFICLVIGHIFPLSPFLHAVCDVPSRLRLSSAETYYSFFPPHFLRSLNLSSPPALVLSIMYQGPFWPEAGWELLLESSSGGTDLGFSKYCYFQHQQGSVCVRPPILIEDQNFVACRKKKAAPRISFLDYKQPYLMFYLWKRCPFMFIIKTSDLRHATSSVQLLEIIYDA